MKISLLPALGWCASTPCGFDSSTTRKNSKAELQRYLKKNFDLPKIAVRETRAVLLTGKKTK